MNQNHTEATFGGLTRQVIQDNLRARKLLDPEPLVAIIKNKLTEEQNKGHHVFVVDGFPRSFASAEKFEEEVRGFIDPPR